MFSRILQRTRTKLYRGSIPALRRGFATSEKESKWSTTTKAVLLISVSVPVGSALYLYATNRHFREITDQNVLSHVPYILKFSSKWFPMDYSSPYKTVVSVF